MPKLFVLYFTWPNTAANHSGMAHLVKELKAQQPDRVRLLEIPPGINGWSYYAQRFYFYYRCLWLRFFLKKADSVLFMEYLGNVSGNQTGIALQLRRWGIKNRFFGLVHLSGNNLLELYGSDDYIKKGLEAADRVIVFGSSLERFITGLGYGGKVMRTFHYVDDRYYKPGKQQKPGRLRVLHMGSIKRNFAQLHEIVKHCPTIDFHICQGHADLKAQFSDLPNVSLYGYLSEPGLLELMQNCQVSLSVLDDTVGSNVITTSMACGLVNIASDVGSIRDYCNETNAVLCRSTDDFVAGLSQLVANPEALHRLHSNSLAYAGKINLQAFISWMDREVLN
jgi:glycosyltransferase involved in cell wall biosynthesis